MYSAIALYIQDGSISKIPYLSAPTTDDYILSVFRICLDLNFLATAWCIHSKAPYPGAVVVPYLPLVGIESDALPNEMVASSTPNIEGHLKSDDQNPLIKLVGPLSQWVLAIILHKKDSCPHVSLGRLISDVQNNCAVLEIIAVILA